MSRQPITLRKWKAARAGSGITVHGEDIDTGLSAKITNVTIQPPTNNALHEVHATDKHGVVHRLIFP